MFDNTREITGFDKNGIHVGTATMTPDGRWRIDFGDYAVRVNDRMDVDRIFVIHGVAKMTMTDGVKR